jgi:DNA-binding MarR family transcriptional regulator/N-acetylglutamate synthase-like GNAT family acetyltransferase
MEQPSRDILADLGHLFLGSRLKRLAERMQADAGRVIRDAGLPIQPAHFPMLAAIDRYGPLTIGDAAEALGVSQPAVTRTAAALVELDLLRADRGDADQRQRTLALTVAGEALMVRARTKVGPAVDAAAADLCSGPLDGFLRQVALMERALDHQSLEARVKMLAEETARAETGLSVRDYSDDLAQAFYDINAEWISSMFTLEHNDIEILSKPRELIVDRGGVILFVEAEGLGLVGTCALIRISEGVYELTKMGVTDAARGRKAGEYLLRKVLERARGMAMKNLYLLTNTKCAAAIHLYEKLGFEHDVAIMRDYGARYERCNVAMSYPL